MPIKITITKDNTAAFLAALDGVVSDALEEIGQRAEAYAKRDVAVDTGELRDSIGFSVNGDTLILGAGTNHALPVEVGTQRMAARPYLRPAMENHGEEYKQITERALKGD